MILDGIFVTEINDSPTERVEQDQTTDMRSIVLLYTLWKVGPKS